MSPPVPLAWVERLFSRMAAYYGARFADAWRGIDQDEIKAVWAEELGAYAVPEIQRGIALLKTRPFPPTLPEFLHLCRPKPLPEVALAEACRLIGRLDGWSNCAVFWAAREIGAHDLKSSRYLDIRGRWIEAFERAWEEQKPIPLPQPVKALLTADAGPPPKRLTAKEKAAIWSRIANFDKQFAMPAKHVPPSRAEVAAAEREIAARQVEAA